TYVLLGDGECQEGQVWEAAMAAGNYELDTLTAIVDSNRYQLDGPVEDIQSLEPFGDKWRAFRWNVIEVDGHDLKAVLHALHEAQAHRGRPTCIIAHTVKGKGVAFMEHNNEFHGKAPNADQRDVALSQLSD
ncbi:MAG TPA: thiamine pyrophosphate-dependent enzyme, partial [Gemmatimonadaceae bacterium]|nr:thiamine pyrophosphate-dependent enzyme [Gemmatimonadaceae bacterium]